MWIFPVYFPTPPAHITGYNILIHLWNCQITASSKYEESLVFSDHFSPAGFCCIVYRLQHETDCIGNKIKAPVKNYSLIPGVIEYSGHKKYSLPIIPAL
jgi:hypothetical protein